MSRPDLSQTEEYRQYCHGELNDLFPFYDRLRREDPVHWCEPQQAWLLSRYEDCFNGFRDKRLSVNRMGYHLNMLPGEQRERAQPVCDHLSKWMLATEPPDHPRLRKLGSEAFKSKNIEALRPQIEAVVDELLDKVQGQGEFDIVADLAFPLPAIVISRILGVPEEDREKFRQWSDDIVAFAGAGGAALHKNVERGLQGLDALKGYFHDRIEQRRSDLGDDVVSALIQAEDNEKLSEEELYSMCTLLLVAGHETTTSLIANGMLALMEHPDQLQLLRDDPSIIESAVEELLRYDSPVHRQTRIASEDLEIGGRSIRKGQAVFLLHGSANRDPEQFPEADRFDLLRSPNKHLAFGGGPHFCPGAPLARLESRIALNKFLERFPNVRRANAAPLEYRPNISIRALLELPVVG